MTLLQTTMLANLDSIELENGSYIVDGVTGQQVISYLIVCTMIYNICQLL